MLTKLCEKCGKPFPKKFGTDGKFHNLQRRKYCFDCSPFGEHNTKNLYYIPKQKALKECSLCGRVFSKSAGYSPAKCNSCKTKIRRIRTKLAAVEYLGGKCQRCGWSGNIAALEFHHRNPDQKDFMISSVSNRKWEVVCRELDKCELLCSNCHRIEHSNRTEEKWMLAARNYSGRLLVMDR